MGIADLGSNTARLMVFDYEAGRAYRMVEAIREPVRLGEGLARDGRMTPAAVSRALAAVELFEDYGGAVDLDDLEILATSAVRDAANRDEVLGPIRDAGYSVRVLPGTEEAELATLAVANSFDLHDAWIMDLGGGSSQISRMQNRRWVSGDALPLGAVRLTEAFVDSDPPSAAEVAALERRVAERAAKLADDIATSGLPLVGVGGTIRNLARLDMKRRDYPLPVLHGYRFRRQGLEAITEQLLETTYDERVRMAGVRPYRADILVAGALVYRWLLRAAGLESIEISGQGVREGALYRHLFPDPPHLVDDVRRFTIDNLALRHGEMPSHGSRVETLCRALFRGLSPLHGLGEVELELLTAAATLHDIGTNLDYYRHHKHGAYLLTSLALPGFRHREQLLIALLVRYHRKGNPKIDGYEEVLSEDDLRTLVALTACLRMAESLERSRAGRVAGLDVRVGDETIVLELAAAEPPTVEMWEAARHGELFEQAFGRRLVVTSSA